MAGIKKIIETIAIGDELLVGKIADTNSQFVARQLFGMGLRLSRVTVVADEPSEMANSLSEAASRAQVVIVFGGLGPTSDDKTAEVAAQLLACNLIENPQSKTKLLEFLKQRGRPVTPASLKQVLYPERATPIWNPVGLAPGFEFKLGECRFYFLPGVPMEMEAMVLATVVPELKLHLGSAEILSHCWRCVGIAEAQLQEKMNPTERALPEGCYLGYRTSFPENHLTLYWAAKQGLVGFENLKIEIRKILKSYCYSENDAELEQVVVESLKQRTLTLALAESCTGGLTMQRLTRVPGASKVIWGGVASYQLAAKKTLLGVELASDDDGVSRESSEKLARAIKEKSQCEISAAVTGYMGPDAGAKDPLGTIYLCVFGKQLVESKMELLPLKDRYRVQWGTATFLLRMIQLELEEMSKKGS